MRKHRDRADYRRKPIVNSLEERSLLSVYHELSIMGSPPPYAPAVDVGQQFMAPVVHAIATGGPFPAVDIGQRFMALVVPATANGGPVPAVDVGQRFMAPVVPATDTGGPVPAVDVGPRFIAPVVSVTDTGGFVPAVDVGPRFIASVVSVTDTGGPVPAVDVGQRFMAPVVPATDTGGPVPAVNVGLRFMAMPDEAFGPPTLNGPSVPPYWYWLTQESDLARERDLFDRDAMTAARSFSTTDQSNVAVSPPAPNAVPLIRDGHGFATDVVLASRSLVAAPAPVTSDHEGRAVTPKVRSEERPVPMASSTAPGLPPSSESSGGGVSGIDPVARPKSNGDSARHGDSLDSPGEGPREVPPPHGAGLIAELLPFDRATLERAVDRFLNAFEDLGVPGMVEAAQSPPPLMLAIMFAALEVARRRLRQSDKTARSGRLAPGLVRGRFPELLGTSSVKRP